MTEDTTEVLAGAIRVDEQQLRGHIDEAVRCSVEETMRSAESGAQENAKLKHLVADLTLDKHILGEIVRKKA